MHTTVPRDTIQDQLLTLITEATGWLIDELTHPVPFRCDNEEVVHYGLVREKYGFVCGLDLAAEQTGLDYTEIQAAKELAAKEYGICWDDLLKHIQY